MVNMSNLKFQMNSVAGKPQIFFSQDKPEKNSRKFGYKNREQRFPLRDRGHEEIQPPRVGKVAASKQPPGRVVPAAQRRPPGGGAKKPTAPGGGTVTLTQEQLELILSSVGKTVASDRDNSVRISVERTDGGLSIEADARRYRRGRDYSDDDSALGETADTGGSADEEERTRKKRTPPQASKPTGGAENILGLLSKVEGDGKGGKVQRKRPVEVKQREPLGRGAKKANEVRGGGGRGGGGKDAKEAVAAKGRATGERKEVTTKKKEKASDNDDMDKRMQRIIAENKEKMSEAELVDLLAAVYLEERQMQLMGQDQEEERHTRTTTKEERRRRQDDDDEDDDGDYRRSRRRYDGRGRDSGHDVPRSKPNRRPGRRREDSDDDRSDIDYEEEEEERRRRSRRQREPPRRRRRYSRSEDDEDEMVEHDRKSKNRRAENRGRRKEEESDEEGNREEDEEPRKPQVEAPKFLTIAEKKRLQWEKERQELKNLKTYDPWGRPGAGAPPKDSPSPPAMSKKEEEQSRYARELSDQLKEKRELQMREQRRLDGPSAGDGGLHNVESDALQLSGSFARGRGMANLDEKIKTDLEEQRRRHVEHQEAIKRQVEERQAKRAQERERRIREELEEEARLQRERDRLQRQFEDEQARSKRREIEHESRLAQLQAANEAAEQAAKIDKARRRMEKLEGGGHDTSALRANYEAELTARSQNLERSGDLPTGLSRPAEVQMTTFNYRTIPGLEGIAEALDTPVADKWATPRNMQAMPPPAPVIREGQKEDFQAQTDMSLLQPLLHQAMELAAISTAHAQEEQLKRRERPPPQPQSQRKIVRGGKVTQRFQHGFVIDSETQQPGGRRRQPIPVHERPKWGNNNAVGRRTLKQSEREVGDRKRQEREERKARRQAELMAKVEANERRIPRKAPVRRHSDSRASPSPHLNYQEAPAYMATYNLEVPDKLADNWREPIHTTGRQSPPVPALRRDTNRGAVGMSRSEENLAALVGTAAAEPRDLHLVRTSEILNPAKAERPLPVSREDTARQMARKTYFKGLNPAHYGDYMANLDDHRMEQHLPNKTTNAKNPIFNPGIVKDMPTPRQDAILQHLSDIRKNLLQKQKEIETSLSMGDNVA